MSKTGNLCDATTTVDMDDGNGPQTMSAYILAQVPEINGSADKGASITLSNGNVTSVTYTEGAFTALWDSTNGMQGATKSGDSSAHTAAGVGTVAVS